MAQRREVPRYECDLKGELVLAQGQETFPVRVVILSTRGGAVEGPGALRVGQKYQFVVEWQGRTIQAPARLVWKTPRGLVGLKFLSIGEEDLDLLREVLSTLNLQPPTKLPQG